jgi:hypothetical protein
MRRATKNRVTGPKSKRKCKILFINPLLEVRRQLFAATMIRNTMRKGFAITAITVMVGPKSHGTAPMRSYMLKGCARIAILMSTTK